MTTLRQSRREPCIEICRVSDAAHREFLRRVRTTHDARRPVPDFVQDLIPKQMGGLGTINVGTVVAWASAQVFDTARSTVRQMQKLRALYPIEMRARLGIEAHVATCKEVGN